MAYVNLTDCVKQGHPVMFSAMSSTHTLGHRHDIFQSIITLSRWWPGIVVCALVSINEVNLRRARLVLGWVTVSGFSSRCRTFISVCNQSPRSTQPGHRFVGRRNEYQPKGGDALRLGSKDRYGSYVGGR